MALFGRRKPVGAPQLPLTPMIDVTFQLLIFFMVGMKFREIDRKLEADLPKAGRQADSKELLTELWIRISVRKDSPPGNPQPLWFVDQQAMRDEKHLRATIGQYARLPGARNDTIIIAPTNDAHHGWVMTALDYLNQFGFRNINFKQ